MKVRLIENGPLVLDTQESVRIELAGGSEERQGPIFLCRCGKSANKPFCDAAHRKAGFEGVGHNFNEFVERLGAVKTRLITLYLR